MRTIGMYVGLTCALLTVNAQSFPDAAKLLAAQEDLMKSSSTVQYTQQMDMEITVMGNPVKTSTKTRMQYAGDKFRSESGTGEPGSVTMVFDGKTLWMYMPAEKQYSRQDGAVPDALVSQFTSALPDVGALTKGAKVMRSEAIEIDGQVHDCWVVEARMDKIALPTMPTASAAEPVATYWLDKQLGIGLRTIISAKLEGMPGGGVETRSTVTLHEIKINAALPASTFEFTPPEGAKETSNLFATMTSELTGKTVGPGSKGVGPGAGPEAAGGAGATRPPSNYTPQAFVPDLNPTSHIEPKYPDVAKAAKTQGMVQILITIDPAGAVVETEVLSGKEILKAAAVDAVKQWHYRPVLREGRAVYAYTSAFVSVTDPEQPNGASFDEASFGGDEPGMARLFELMRTMPRTPQQELADEEQDLGPLTGVERSIQLPNLATLALAAGALDKASEYAADMLKVDPKDFLYGKMFYDGHTTRGLVALRQGNIALASQDLLESAKTPGSPVLSAAGPNFTLARELFAKGEKSTVLEFLERCKTFWTPGASKLEAWIATIRGGGVPDFSSSVMFESAPFVEEHAK